MDFDILNNLEDDAMQKHSDEMSSAKSEDRLSRNTGIITFTHQGTNVPDIVSKLSLLHEIGHSLGSPVTYMIYFNIMLRIFLMNLR